MSKDFPEKIWISSNSELISNNIIPIKYKGRPLKSDILYIRHDKFKDKLEKKQNEIDKLTIELNNLVNEYSIKTQHEENKSVFD